MYFKVHEEATSMFDTLLELPLFQGLSLEDFHAIITKVKLEFNSYKAKEKIIKSGDSCNKLHFLLKGEMQMSTTSADGKYVITETMKAPCLIEPQSLFGMNTKFKSSYNAKTRLSTLSISKEYFLSNLLQFEIFRLNYMNIICNKTQNLHSKMWTEETSSLEKRIVRFLLDHFERIEGEKIIKSKMTDMAEVLQCTRLNMSKVLNKLQKEGLADLRRSEFSITDAKKLAEYFKTIK